MYSIFETQDQRERSASRKSNQVFKREKKRGRKQAHIIAGRQAGFHRPPGFCCCCQALPARAQGGLRPKYTFPQLLARVLVNKTLRVTLRNTPQYYIFPIFELFSLKPGGDVIGPAILHARPAARVFYTPLAVLPASVFAAVNFKT